MTTHAAYVYPLPEIIRLDLSDSFDAGFERPAAHALVTVDYPTIVTHAHVLAGWRTRTHAAYVFPDWSSFLFDHVLTRPASIALGSVLSNQTRTIEFANLSAEPVELEALTTDIIGLTFVNAPSLPLTIPPFGSFTLEVAIDADGPATIDGDIVATFSNGETITIAVSGVRLILFQYQPQLPIAETLEFKSDVLVAVDGTEQRITIRNAPRSRLAYAVILDHRSDGELRGKLFDWLARSFVVPFWPEARRLSAAAAAAAESIAVSTAAGDFRVGGLAFIWSGNEACEALEIEGIAAGSLSLASGLTRAYPIGALVMPARLAFAQTVPAAPRIPRDLTQYQIEFVTTDNVNLADVTGAALYDGRVILDDCNLIVAGEADGYERTVLVLDNDSGRVWQTSKVDRSRFRTKKVWDCPSQADLWRVRRLLHYFAGSRRAFWLPTFREDMRLTDTIGPSATTFEIEAIGFTAFYQARRPFADVRLVKNDGATIIRRVTGAHVDASDASVEVITIASAFAAGAIAPADVSRIEFVLLVRIADDTASLTHNRLGDATIEINLVSVKE